MSKMLEHYRSWLEKKPEDRLALYGLAFELKKAGESTRAAEAFEALLALHPHSGAGWFQYGSMYEDEDEERAIEVWRRGLAALADASGADARRSIAEIEAALAMLE